MNPIRRHVAGLSAKPLTILTACLIWVLAIVLAMPAAFFSYVPTVPLQSNHSILICSPFPEEFGEYFTSNEYPLSGKRIFHLSKKKKNKNYLRSIFQYLSRIICTKSYRMYRFYIYLVPDRRTELSKGNGDVQVPRLLCDTVASDNWILSGDGTTPRTIHQEYARRVVHRMSSYGTN